MNFFLKKRPADNAMKRWVGIPLLCLSTLCLSTLVAHAQADPSTSASSGTPSKSGSNTASSPASNGSQLTLNGQQPNSDVTVYVPDQQATLYLLPPAGAAQDVEYTVIAIEFPLKVTLKKPDDQGAASSMLAVKADPKNPAYIPLVLVTQQAPQGDQPPGTLLVTSKNGTLTWKIHLKMPDATLALDRLSVNQGFTESLGLSLPLGQEVRQKVCNWLGCETSTKCSADRSPAFTVNVHEKSGKLGLEGVYARLEQVVKSPPAGFDLAKNVVFSFNGTETPKFTQWPPDPNPSEQSVPPSGRSIPPSGQAAVQVCLTDLHAGEYSVVLRFLSSNSSPSDDGKFTLNLQVRHNPLWPLLVLILAVFLSFISTKVITSLRKRFEFMGRIEQLKPAWLDNEPKLLPVVWAQAVLRQSQELSDTFWLTGEDEVEKRVNHAEDIMNVLDKIRLLRIDIQTFALRKYQKYRALAKLNGIVSSIGSEFLDNVMMKEVDDELNALRQWLQENSMPYWLDLRADIRVLLSEVDPDWFPPLYEPLKTIRDNNDVPEQGKLIVLEDQYAVMKLLWERKDYPELQEFRDSPQGQADKSTVPPPQELPKTDAGAKQTGTGTEGIKKEQVFGKADRAAWERLKSANKTGGLKIKMPDRDDFNPSAAYTPIPFSVEPVGDQSLANTYLFRHGLKFEWEFIFTAENAKSEQSGHKSETTAGTKLATEGQIPSSSEQRTNVNNDNKVHKSANQGKTKSKKPSIMILKPVTEEPQIVQYFPQAGTVSVSVKISCTEALRPSANSAPESTENEQRNPENIVIAAKDSQPLIIEDCNDFDWLRGLQNVEVGSFIAAGFAAVVSGMTTYYLNKPGFGSASDYLTMFIWGVGIDQGKNFIQNLQAYSK